MPERINTQVLSQTRSGRFAVFARYRPNMPWIQVDSCDTARLANAEATRLEANSKVRGDVIDEWLNENWGKDAPLTPPAP